MKSTARRPLFPSFPEQEYKARWGRARELMGEEGLDGLLITEGNNFSYLASGIKEHSTSRPNVLILPREGEPLALVHWFPRESRREESWLKELRVYRYGHPLKTGPPLEELKGAFHELGLERARMGAELGFEQRLGISYETFSLLKESLPQADFSDASRLLWELRSIKSPLEIERIREACAITGRAYGRLFSELKLGTDEGEAARRLKGLMEEEGGSDPWYIVTSSPENYRFVSRNSRPLTARLEAGNFLWFDGGCSFGGYFCDFSRGAFLGEPTGDAKRVTRLVIEITEALVSAVRPGVSARELDALNLREWKKAGIDYLESDFGGGRVGHGVGLAINEPPNIAPYDETALKPGMVFTLEPGLVTEFGTFHFEENLVVTERGCEVFTEFSKEPPTVGA